MVLYTVYYSEYSLLFTVQRTIQLPRRWAIIIITNPEISATTMMVALTFLFFITVQNFSWSISFVPRRPSIHGLSQSLSNTLGFAAADEAPNMDTGSSPFSSLNLSSRSFISLRHLKQWERYL